MGLAACTPEDGSDRPSLASDDNVTAWVEPAGAEWRGLEQAPGPADHLSRGSRYLAHKPPGLYPRTAQEAEHQRASAAQRDGDVCR